MTVFLCGFMGCGKTSAGTELARITGRKFTDMDKYIEEEAKLTIPEIFAEKGEHFFRAAETDAVKKLAETGGIVACGGGAMLNAVNAKAARDAGGKIVYIDVPFETCYERISGDTHRPIVMANTKESLLDIYEMRIPHYLENSDAKADGSGTPAEIAERIRDICGL